MRIYIILYKEFSIICDFKSKFAQTSLEKMSKNIHVLRHSKMFSYWSHHEKSVIIDKKIAFVGGLDIAYGRFDTKQHCLSDLPNEDNKVMFPGADYSNERISELKGMDQYYVCKFEREETQRMPWHYVSMKLEGPVVDDLVKHFVEVKLISTGIM